MPVEDASYIGKEFERLVKNSELENGLLETVKEYAPLVKFTIYYDLGHKRPSNGEIKLFAAKAQTRGEMEKVGTAARKIADIIDANYGARE